VSDPFDPDSDLSVDAETFQQWVTHTANSRGVDEHELLNQLVSAFWVLDEMSDVAANVDEGVPPSADDAWSDRSGPADGDADRGDDTPSDAHSNRNSDGRSDPETAATEPFSTSDSGGEGDIGEEIDELRQSLRTEMDLLRTVTELRRQVADLSLDVEQQRDRQEQFTDRLSDDITRLHSRIESIDAGTDETDSELRDRVAELQRGVAELESTHDEFETWIDDEFDEIEALFNRLIETTQQLDARLDDVEETVDTVARADRIRGDLSDLRREAQQLNVDSGRCESCDTQVDLSMLTEPACPSCDETFTGVAAGRSWNPFSDPTLRTRSASADPTPPADFEPPPRE
jgi:rubrerythrin